MHRLLARQGTRSSTFLPLQPGARQSTPLNTSRSVCLCCWVRIRLCAFWCLSCRSFQAVTMSHLAAGRFRPWYIEWAARGSGGRSLFAERQAPAGGRRVRLIAPRWPQRSSCGEGAERVNRLTLPHLRKPFGPRFFHSRLAAGAYLLRKALDLGLGGVGWCCLQCFPGPASMLDGVVSGATR